MAIEVALPSFRFASKIAATDHVRDQILYKYAIGDTVTDKTDEQLLRELVDRSDDGGEKRGPGIEFFYIARTADGDRRFVAPNARGIWIRRTDGTSVDWSYTSAIRRPSAQAQAKDALRLAVEDKRKAFRDGAFAAGTAVYCYRSGAIISSREKADVVYEKPSWQELTDGFASTVGGWDALKTHSGAGGVKVGRGLTESNLEVAWRAYWEAEAHPRLVLNT